MSILPRAGRSRRARGVSLLASLLACAAPIAAQGDEPPPGQENSKEVEELRRRLEALEERYEDDVSDLRFQLEGLEEEADELRRAAAPTAQRLNVFNPQITVFGNFLGRVDDRPVFAEDDPSGPRVDDTLRLREVELDLRAAVDPWADGVLIVSHEAEVPGESETSIEEGYVTLKKLPFLDTAPAGLKLQIGRFRPTFGGLNRIHLHDLPQVDYPRSLRTFLGEEGYVQDGVSARFFLPSPGDTTTLEATAALLGGGDLPVAPTERASNLAGLGRLEWFQELTADHSLDLGASVWHEESDRRLWGVDATWEWKPRASGEYRSFLLGGELFGASLDDPAFDRDPLGYFVWSQVQLDRNTYAGVRYDRSEELADASLATDTYGAYLTYYTTEFLRFRLGLEHQESDVDLLDGRDSAFLEVNFVFGSHPVEPYWVNR